jgi:spore coat polysaccharide biosynthesis protein SpsF
MRTKTPQELYWESAKGTDWFERNQTRPTSRLPVFKDIISRTFGVRSICELGCGNGTNLLAIGSLSKNFELTGVELNPKAISILADHPRIRAIHSSIQDLDINERFDLVLLCGVLIHINDELPIAYEQIDRLSSRYVLICEYFNPTPVEVNYHGQSGLLIKRDFAKEFLQSMNGKYSVLDYGFVWREIDPAWDNINWTLLEKAEVENV